MNNTTRRLAALTITAFAAVSALHASRPTGFNPAWLIQSRVAVAAPKPTPTPTPTLAPTPTPTPAPTPAPIVKAVSYSVAELRAKTAAYVAESRQWAHLYQRSSAVWPAGSDKQAEYQQTADSFEDRARGAEELFRRITGENL